MNDNWRLHNWALVVLVVIAYLLTPQLSSQQVLFEGPVKQQSSSRLNDPSKAKLSLKRSPDQRLSLVEADENGLYLLGLFDVHQSNPRIPFKCGPIDADAGQWRTRRPIQNLEAFLWAIEQVNADKQLLPGIRLGSLVMDTCSSFLRTNQQLANLLHQQPSTSPALPNVRQLMAVVADNQDWPSVEAVASMSSALGLATFVTQSRSSKLAELARRYHTSPSLSAAGDQWPSSTQSPIQLTGEQSQASADKQFEGLLGDLMGIGKMIPSALSSVMNVTAPQQDPNQQQRLYMVRMLMGNEILADSLASLCQRMNWDLVSLIYDDELDMIDLHEELARQLFSRNIQLALDEQIPTGSPIESYNKLIQRLASKTQIGSRVVLTLLGTGSARSLLESLVSLRNQAKLSSSSPDLQLVRQANSLLWVTISDREPYYSLATNALGTVAISNSVSLIPEFKSHFDGLTSSERHLAQNPWWPEYMKSILTNHHKDIELISDECAKWQAPHASLLPEKCRSLSLSDLVKIQQLNSLNSKTETVNESGSNKNKNKIGKQQQPDLSKYLAGGWEHNGMDVINSVLAIANGLESVRQTLCPDKLEGICDEMRQFISPQSFSRTPSSPEEHQQTPLPMMSELIYNELLRSTFQLADGRLFNLIEDGPANELMASGGHQLEGKLRLFNLRYLQPNSIGFVKFGTFDRQDGLLINSSKALHYSPTDYNSNQVASPKKNQAIKSLPLDQVKSSCEDSSKCLMLSQFLAPDEQFSALENSTRFKDAISEEELASGLNSLFKLDHPAIVSGQQQQDKQTKDLSSGGGSGQSKHQAKVADKLEGEEQGKTHEIRWQPPISDHFNWPDSQVKAKASQVDDSERRNFEVVVLLPLHKRAAAGSNRSCSRQLNLDSSFQHLAALAFASQSLAMMNGQAKNGSKQIMQLTTTVIDYCEQVDLAEQKLSHHLLAQHHNLDRGNRRRTVAVIDFDESVSQRVDNLPVSDNLLHLTVGSPATDHGIGTTEVPPKSKHLHLSLMPSKTKEIEALLSMIAAVPQWKLVHLIYTDHHRYRDEFVRRANEANICVSKLIWIPQMNYHDGEEYDRQLDKTRRLFLQELHDYRSPSLRSAQQADGQSGQVNEGLNSTRILVVLASGSSRYTNKLILEASSESMLEDYVWLTSHEWLWSSSQDKDGSHESSKTRKPHYFVSTRFESSHESHEFSNYLSQLTPAIHRPLPTDWFDEFWQQKFTCRLPISDVSTGQANSKPLPVCAPNHRLDMHMNFRLDDRVHFVIRAITALQLTLESIGTSPYDESGGPSIDLMMNLFREKYEAIDGFGSQPHGFQIIHQLDIDRPENNITSVEGDVQGRRQNSRQLDAGSDDKQELVKVGIWRDGELILATRLASASKFDRGQELPGWLTAAADDISNADGRPQWNRIQRSLAKLESIESQCLTEKTCRLCEQQIEQTDKLIQLEQVRLSQSQSVAEPKAISSIDDHKVLRADKKVAAGKTRKKSSILDSSQPFESDSDQSSWSTASNKSSMLDGIQAAASSLFDVAVRQQIELEQQADLKRHFVEQQQMAATKLRQPSSFVSSSRQHNPALFAGVLISLAGIICMLFTMTHLYPSANYHSQHHQHHQQQQRTRKAEGGPVYGGQMTFRAIDADSGHSGAQISDSQLVNLINYFLLTGLLMLYSINVAFVLPATVTVCWFRRIGLATSYTLIFSSMLAQMMVHITMRQTKAKRKTAVGIQPVVYPEDDPAGGGEESEVEVTFESLPQINEQATVSENQSSNNSNCAIPRRLNEAGYQVRSSSGGQQRPAMVIHLERANGGGMPLTISMSLMIIQLVVSFVWLIEQPPEPTLYLSCWYCSSPSRSQTLFLYEPLLSLLYPAFVLLLTWFSALVYYHFPNNDRHHKDNLIVRGQPAIAQTNNYHPDGRFVANFTDRMSDFKKRDSRSLLVTTTLLIVSWSIVTLKMISSTDAKLSNSSSSSSKQLAFDCNTVTLVYANIISGAIIFTTLFLYRLEMIQCNPMRWKIGRRSNEKLSGEMQNSTTSSFRSILENYNGSCILYDDSIDRNLFFTRTISEFTPQTDLPMSATTVTLNGDQHERLGLRQFNSYGTYNQDNNQLDEPVSHLDRIHQTACDSNKPHRAKKRSKRLSKSSILRAFTGSTSGQSETSDCVEQQQVSGHKRRTPHALKLQRQPSVGSVASSTTKLVTMESEAGRDPNIDDEDDLFAGDDTISCASSVASSSTSQLHGNDLYPIDCSLQLDSQLPNATLSQSGLIRTSSFRRQSTRRPMNKLSSVSEEQIASSDPMQGSRM